MKILCEPAFLSILGLTGLTGLLAMVSPRLFASMANYGSRLASATATQTRWEKWIDIDQYVLGHARFFGVLVTGSVVYLWLLSTYGPEAFSKPFLVMIVGASLTIGIVSLAEIRKQKHQLENRLLEAHTDSLTGLANRRSFDMELARRIAQHQRQGNPLCLLIIDVDRFKTFNDTYGHLVGDGVLKELAKILARNVGSTEVVARLGGDEFAVSLPGSNLSDATRTAERIRGAVGDRIFLVERFEIRLTVSIGLAEAVKDDDEVSLIKRADSALYAAKDAGRNCSYRHGSPEPAAPKLLEG